MRLFGAGGPRVRTCPACERKIEADATFCPSCYMVFRPEGSAALREYLQGARIPTDVYLLRKLQSEDPNAGPVTRDSEQAGPPQIEIPAPTPVQSVNSSPSRLDPGAPPPVESAASHSDQPIMEESTPLELKRVDESTVPKNKPGGRRTMKMRSGVEGLLAFHNPFPPLTVSVEDVPGLFAWMLERDPLIPNNLDRLGAIHRAVFQDKPAACLGYEQHLILQVAEDLGLYGTKECLGFHLAHLATAYRRASDAYRNAESDESAAANTALWQMASLATRLRMEAWVYYGLHGESPQLPSTRQRELPLKFHGN